MLFLTKFLPELFTTTPMSSPGGVRHFQDVSDSTSLAGSEFAVAWRDVQTPGGGIISRTVDVGAGIFDSAGKLIVSEVVDTGAVNYLAEDYKPSVTTLSNGNWVVAWDHTQSTPGGFGPSTAYADIFSPTGQMVGSRITIVTTSGSISGLVNQPTVVITPLPGNEFVATWVQLDSSTTYGIHGQIYSGTGQTIGSQFLVETGSAFATPLITPLANDRFLSAWFSTAGIQGQIFDINGNQVGGTLSLEPVSTSNAAVAGFANGNFVLTWEVSNGSAGKDVHAQLFDPTGAKIGSEIAVNTVTNRDQTQPAIVVLPDDSFVISWTDASVFQPVIKLQHFDSNGALLGSETLVNTLSAVSAESSLAVVGTDELLVSWSATFPPPPESQNASGIDSQLFKLTPAPVQPAHNDINRDGHSDVLFYNDNGATAVWEMNGARIQLAAGLGALSPGSKIAGTGDFDGDQLSDLLLQDNNGSVAMWEMFGTTIKLAAGVGPLPAGFSVAGTGDFDGDQRTDVVLQRADGAVALWEMNGPTIKLAVGAGSLPSGYKVAGTGDFDGDGRADLLLSNGSHVALWEMNGASVKLAAGVGSIPTNNIIAGTGDFNGDGHTDVLFKDSNNFVSMWELDGPTIKLGAGVGFLPAGYDIAGTGDLNGDGKTDLLLHDSAGHVATWEMNGPTVQLAAGIGALTSDFHIIA
jgi:hypothetical protein